MYAPEITAIVQAVDVLIDNGYHSAADVLVDQLVFSVTGKVPALVDNGTTIMDRTYRSRPETA